MDKVNEPSSAANSASAILTISIIGLMFFIFGFVTWLNGPLITFVKLAFTLSDVEAFLVPSVFYMSYFFLAIPSALILKRTGMKKGMVLGLLTMAVGAAIFGQFATMRIFPGALTGLFIIGAGLAVLQTAANPYISVVGPIESAAQRIAVMGICNKLAGIAAPFVIGALVMQGIGELDAQVKAVASSEAREALLNAFAAKVHLPYLAMAGILALLALFVLKSPLPEIKSTGTTEASQETDKKNIFSYSNLWFGVLCLFLYVGVEVLAGDAIGTYGAEFGLPISRTAFFTVFTLIAMLIGYLVGLVVIPRFVSQERYLAFSAVLGIAFAVGAYCTQDYVSVGFVAALGFANAMMWPAIFPLAIRGLGRFTEIGAAILIMGISGGAIVPQLFVILKQTYNFQLVFMALAVISYFYILFFALAGSRVKNIEAP